MKLIVLLVLCLIGLATVSAQTSSATLSGTASGSASPATVSGTASGSASPATVSGTASGSASPATVSGTASGSASPATVSGTASGSASPATVSGTASGSASPATASGTASGSASPATVSGTASGSASPVSGTLSPPASSAQTGTASGTASGLASAPVTSQTATASGSASGTASPAAGTSQTGTASGSASGSASPSGPVTSAPAAFGVTLVTDNAQLASAVAAQPTGGVVEFVQSDGSHNLQYNVPSGFVNVAVAAKPEPVCGNGIVEAGEVCEGVCCNNCKAPKAENSICQITTAVELNCIRYLCVSNVCTSFKAPKVTLVAKSKKKGSKFFANVTGVVCDLPTTKNPVATPPKLPTNPQVFKQTTTIYNKKPTQKPGQVKITYCDGTGICNAKCALTPGSTLGC